MKHLLLKNKHALILLALVFITFGKSIFATFYYDDTHSIVDNISVHSLANIPTIWTDASTSSFIIENRTYRPLTYTFFTICWALGGGSPAPFHILKLFMHFMVAFAVFLMWKKLWATPGWFPVQLSRIRIPFLSQPIIVNSESFAFLLAAIFAIHTACSECVDYVSATSSLQCAVFYVWAFYYYLVYRTTARPKHILLSLFLYFCSVASKEEGITLPAMVFIVELFLLSGPWRLRVIKAIRRVLPYALLSFVMAFWLYEMHPQEGNISRGALSSFSYFMTQWRAYLWYMRLWFWPWDLNADNLVFGFSNSITEGPVLQALIGNVLLISTAWWFRSKFPAFLFGLIWFYVTISPASSVVVLAEPVNEHRMYLAYLGFIGGSFIVVLSILEHSFGEESASRLLPVLYLLAAIGLFIGSQERNWVWANNKNLWTDTVEKNPTSGRAMNNLALVYMGEGNVKKGIELVENCEKIWNEYMYCPLNRGLGYLSLAENSRLQGDTKNFDLQLEQAKISLERARLLNPLSVHSNYHLGRYFQDYKNDCVSAKFYYETAVRLNGDRFPNGQAKLAMCYRKLGQIDQANESLRKAYELEPKNELVLSSMGDGEFNSNNLDKAREIYTLLTQYYPEKPAGHVGIALVAFKQKDYRLAATSIQKWVAIAPNSLQALLYFGLAVKKLGDQAALAQIEQRYEAIRQVKGEFTDQLAKLEQTQ